MAAAATLFDPFASAFLLVETTRNGEPVWAAKWRSATGARIKRRLGLPAWLRPDGDGGWSPLPGRPDPGYANEKQARKAMASIIAGAERAVEEHNERVARAAQIAATPTFRQLIEAWLHKLETVDDVKPSTLKSYGFMLAEPGTPHKRGGGKARGHVMAALGDMPLTTITTADVAAVLDRVAADGVKRATVNRYREAIVASLNFAIRADQAGRWGIRENVAAATPKRRVEEAGRLEVFTVEQVEALARCAEQGAWRTPRPYETPNSIAFRIAEDKQFGELLRIASYTGLRRGELVVLRWRDVHWADRVLVVERALSDREERSTKGRRVRYVPLGDQALGALDRLSKRDGFTEDNDYVFCNGRGDRLDPSALRTRFIYARDHAGLPRLRFHDLRHTAGTLMTRVLDPVTVKSILGHADLKTTERYLHAIKASELGDSVTRAFTPAGSAAPAAPTDPADALVTALLDQLGPDRVARLLSAASGAEVSGDLSRLTPRT